MDKLLFLLYFSLLEFINIFYQTEKINYFAKKFYQKTSSIYESN